MGEMGSGKNVDLVNTKLNKFRWLKLPNQLDFLCLSTWGKSYAYDAKMVNKDTPPDIVYFNNIYTLPFSFVINGNIHVMMQLCITDDNRGYCIIRKKLLLRQVYLYFAWIIQTLGSTYSL